MHAASPAVINGKSDTAQIPAHTRGSSVRRWATLWLVTAGAILVHGYHPFVEDAAIYTPGIKKLLNPALYPYNQGFFASHASMTFYPNLIAWSTRLTHLPFEWVLLCWHALCILVLLCGCWKLGYICFRSERAAWGGTLLVGALLTIPVAGTALYIMDQYVNPRSFSTASAVWIISTTLERKYVQVVVWIALTALIHPLMSVFSLAFAILLIAWDKLRSTRALAAFFIPAALFPPMTPAYRQVLETRSYFFILRWEWFEWLGVVGPPLLFWWFAYLAKQSGMHALRRISLAAIAFSVLCVTFALAITVPPQLMRFAELQPMRGLLLVYVFLLVIGGGLLALHVLRLNLWRWLALFVPMCAGMFYAQRHLFPYTDHIELPGRNADNAWLDVFLWIRDNSPKDAYFALNPEHMRLPGEDQHGFRAMAERSMLADAVKDSGAVSMFPALAQTWLTQLRAQQGWTEFGLADFRRLHATFGVTWFVVTPPQAAGLDCTYRSSVLLVCRLPDEQQHAGAQ